MRGFARFFILLWAIVGNVVPVSLINADRAFAVPAQPKVRVLTIDGVINPLSARYFKRELNQAILDKAEAVVLQLNTPGGLESSMREMTQQMLNSEIPVIVYVTPQGARAASAGMFLTIAAHIAVMAPGTNIGAAHPVGIGGGGAEQKPDKVMQDKVVNDAAALARSIAKARDRNIPWAEKAVRKSVSITAHEALKLKVIDLVAGDLNEALAQVHGRKVQLSSGATTIRTQNAQINEKPMHLPEQILHVITDPNIAYLLLTIGLIGIIAELYSPGLFFPGITGAISLILGFAALGSLPIGWAGVILLVLGIGLLFLEANNPGFGIFGIAGIVAFVLGSLMLYRPLGPVSPSLPRVSVDPWIIGAAAVGFGLFMLLVMRAVVIARRLPVATGRAALVGKRALVLADLSPKGIIKLNSERWTAVADPTTRKEDDTIRAGDVVEIVGLDGAILKVRKTNKTIQTEITSLRKVGKL